MRRPMKKPLTLIFDYLPKSLTAALLRSPSDKGGDPPIEVARLLPPPARTGRAKSFDGTEIAWELHGPLPSPKGPTPHLFCYGLACSINQWREQIAHFSRTNPCLVFDYRGHHASAFPKDPRLMNLSALARDARSVVQALEIKRPVHVWGHSLGCNVALEFALAEPGLAKSLVLLCGTIESPFHNMLGLEDWLDRIMRPVLAAYASREEAYNRVWSLFMQVPGAVEVIAKLAGFNRDASTNEDIHTYAQAVMNVAPQTFFPLLIELSSGTTAAILPKIKTPALVIAGAKDKVTPPIEQKLLADKLGDAVYVEVPAGSHNVQLDFGDYVCMKATDYWRTRGLL